MSDDEGSLDRSSLVGRYLYGDVSSSSERSTSSEKQTESKFRSKSEDSSRIFQDSSGTLAPGMTRIRNKEIERGVRIRNVINSQQTRLVDEKQELHELNSRLDQLVESVKNKKNQNDELQDKINKFRNEILYSSNNNHKKVLESDLDGSKVELNRISEVSTMAKIRASRSMYELDRMKEKYDEEVRWQSRDHEKIRLLETQRTESLHELSYLKENCETKQKSLLDDSDRNAKLREQLRNLSDSLDREQESRVDLECRVQTLLEKKKFDQELQRIMREELEKLFLNQGSNRAVDPMGFYTRELREIKDKIREDFKKLNEYNHDSMKEEYEYKYSKIVEEVEIKTKQVAEARLKAELEEKSSFESLTIEFDRNNEELKNLKLQEFNLSKLLQELQEKLADLKNRNFESNEQKQREIDILYEQINNLKADLSSMLSFSKSLDSEVAVYARLLNQRMNSFVTQTYTFENYENLVLRDEKTTDNYRVMEQNELRRKQQELEENNRRLKELEEQRRRQKELEELQRVKREREEEERRRKLKEKEEEERRQREYEELLRIQREEEERRRREYEEQLRIQREYEEKIRRQKAEEEERLRIQREEEERRRREYEEQVRIQREFEEKKRRQKAEEEERLRIQREEEERRRREYEEQVRIQREYEEKIRIQREEEERIRREEQIKAQREYEEKIRRQKAEEEERRRERREYEEQIKIQREYEEKVRRQRDEEERLRRIREEEERIRLEQIRIQREYEEKIRIQRDEEMKRQIEYQEHIRVQREVEEKMRRQKETDDRMQREIEEERRRQKEIEEKRRQKEIDDQLRRQIQEQQKYQNYVVIKTDYEVKQKEYLEQQRIEKLKREREEHEKYILEKLRQEQELIEAQKRQKYIQENRVAQPVVNCVDNVSTYTKRIVEENHQSREIFEEHRFKTDCNGNYEKQINIQLNPASQYRSQSHTNLSNNINNNNNVVHKNIVITNINRSQSPPKNRIMIHSNGSMTDLSKAETNNKYAIKHKANRYVSGAIGILETSLNGEYIILENLSSNKSVNLKGWYIHRFVPDQNINVTFKFVNDTVLNPGEKLKILSNRQRSASMHEGLNKPPRPGKCVEKIITAHNIENWGTYSKFSVTKLINQEGVDKAVLTQSLLKLASSTNNLSQMEEIPLPEGSELSRNLRTTSRSSTNLNELGGHQQLIRARSASRPCCPETTTTTTTKKTTTTTSTSQQTTTTTTKNCCPDQVLVTSKPPILHVTRQF